MQYMLLGVLVFTFTLGQLVSIVLEVQRYRRYATTASTYLAGDHMLINTG
jgi:hypothetical protein